MTDAKEPERYVLGIAYQAGRDERIMKGQDGNRDWFAPAELRKAAASFMKSLEAGVLHLDNTFGHIQITESYCWPEGAPDWIVKTAAGDVVVKAGDWLVGGILDEPTWRAVKDGRLTGWSPQGTGVRIRKA